MGLPPATKYSCQNAARDLGESKCVDSPTRVAILVAVCQVSRGGAVEPALVTVGDDLNTVARFFAPGRASYSAADVIESMLGTAAETNPDTELAVTHTA